MIILLASLLSIVSSLSEPSYSMDDDSQEVFTQEQVDYINSIQSDWVASKTWLTSLSMGQFKAMLGSTVFEPEPLSEDFFSTKYSQLPASFDARVQWPNCVTPIGTQGSCSASYAFAIAGSLGDRFCIGNSEYQGAYLSSQYILSCYVQDNGCGGGSAYSVLAAIVTNGTALDSCVPYQGVATSCPIKCQNGSPATIYNAYNFSEYASVTEIQTEISTYGPIAATMTVYADFASYTSGVYTHKTGGVSGAQNVKLLGWGNSSGTNYWIGANSWGTTWGQTGYFWIAFGQCGIETLAASVLPSY